MLRTTPTSAACRRRTAGPTWLAAAAFLACAACSSEAASPPSELVRAAAPRVIDVATTGELETKVLQGVPHVRQKPDFCGEACVEMAARFGGRQVNQDQVFDLTGIDPALGRGAFTKELALALGRLGYDIGDIWHEVDVRNPGPGLESQLLALHADLMQGVPSIVCMHYDDSPRTTEHFRLIVGYDRATDEIVYQEPAEDDGAYRRMKRGAFLALWPLPYQTTKWTVIRIPLRPGKLATPPSSGATSPAAIAQHVRSLRGQLGDSEAIDVSGPFVVIGKGPREALREHGGATVRWAREMLSKDFFDASPDKILDVWLYPDKATYDAGVKAITGEGPDTPYGFYSPAHHGLFMNIATGGGTLVHEIVHPFVEADFPDAPAWLNEGLGSLFEQSGERNGHIVGYTNWRLAGLQKAIRKHALPTFEALAKTTSNQFYGDDRGTNYAQARYLFYFMQEKGLLVPFYKAARAARTHDGTGYGALLKTLGESDMHAFQTRWEAYVLGLTFP